MKFVLALSFIFFSFINFGFTSEREREESFRHSLQKFAEDVRPEIRKKAIENLLAEIENSAEGARKAGELPFSAEARHKTLKKLFLYALDLGYLETLHETFWRIISRRGSNYEQFKLEAIYLIPQILLAQDQRQALTKLHIQSYTHILIGLIKNEALDISLRFEAIAAMAQIVLHLGPERVPMNLWGLNDYLKRYSDPGERFEDIKQQENLFIKDKLNALELLASGHEQLGDKIRNPISLGMVYYEEAVQLLAQAEAVQQKKYTSNPFRQMLFHYPDLGVHARYDWIHNLREKFALCLMLNTGRPSPNEIPFDWPTKKAKEIFNDVMDAFDQKYLELHRQSRRRIR